MTIDFYQNKADSFFADTVDVDMSALYSKFLSRLPSGTTILDAGCGSGRDSKAFKSLGYEVTAIDASSEMVRRAAEHSGVDVRQSTFDEVTEIEAFDGIWACASLLHVPFEQLPDSMIALRNALKAGGIWYLSFKYGSGDREKDGRHFTDMNEERFKRLLDTVGGLEVLESWVTVDARPDRNEQWLNLVLKRTV
ncbi:class I SAM-dependent methyltransferase [Shewanella chilikensis]|uniref:class I SAM-dependent methyltransferase n=1 Tax=Shewanella chilikensis TaxID=558541 RepID=UPI00399B9C90